jgi:hypothetical protein
MILPIDPEDRDELFELYSELHLSCGRAAAALRLSANRNAPEEELLTRFRNEEERAVRIWGRILELRGK